MSTDDLTTTANLHGLREIASQVGELKSDRIVSVFEHQILSGRLAPGVRLPTEAELCEILGVSRTVVRDSVRMLVARGLLTVRQGRGTEVATPTDAAYANALLGLLSRSGLSMGEVMQARATIEMTVVAIAAETGTDDEWDALEEVYEEFARAVKDADALRAIRSHAAFHNGILAAVHQPALELMLRPMNEIILVSSATSVLPNGSEEWAVEPHRPIVDALRSRDVDAAVHAMKAHFEVSDRPPKYQDFLHRRFSDGYFDVT